MLISGTIWFLISFLAFSLNLYLRVAIGYEVGTMLTAITLIAAMIGSGFYLYPLIKKK